MTDYLYCRKCQFLVHKSECNVEAKSHSVIGFRTAEGEQREIIHTGLVEEE